MKKPIKSETIGKHQVVLIEAKRVFIPTGHSYGYVGKGYVVLIHPKNFWFRLWRGNLAKYVVDDKDKAIDVFEQVVVGLRLGVCNWLWCRVY